MYVYSYHSLTFVALQWPIDAAHAHERLFSDDEERTEVNYYSPNYFLSSLTPGSISSRFTGDDLLAVNESKSSASVQWCKMPRRER